jgi:AcrR family transcriptional regulator
MAEQDVRKREAARDWVRPAHQIRSRAQRDRLLKAGERVFAEKGFWQAHVTDIVELAGCSVGSFYRRFKDKEALFFALQADMAAQTRAIMEAGFDDPRWRTEPLEDNLERLMRNTVLVMTGVQGYFRALFEMSLRGHDVWRPMRELELYQAQRIADCFVARGAAEQRDGLLTSAHLATRMIHGMIVSTIVVLPGPYEPEDPRFHKELAQLYLKYLGPGPSTDGGPA